MAITRRSAIAIAKLEKVTPPPHHDKKKYSINKEDGQVIAEAPPSKYEQIREQTIKQNRERLQMLGILDLSLKLKAVNPSKTKIHRKTVFKTPSSTLPRRSFRLQKGTPVSCTNAYTFFSLEPKTKKRRPPLIRKVEGQRLSNSEPTKQKPKPKPKQKAGRIRRKKKISVVRDKWSKVAEVYTEEHEKLLGDTDKEWTLCIDGYGPLGSRIYDPINGKTCHQCRQKTLGLRTQCINCNLVKGQFCGDCLYMRYGEHVVEANENPNWICPPCRGICNCSLCRQARGWPPTGNLYRKIKNLGFKSVAHYLLKTNRARKSQSAKRSLPFQGMEVPSDDESRQELNVDGSSEGVGGSNKRCKKQNVDDTQASVLANATASEADIIA